MSTCSIILNYLWLLVFNIFFFCYLAVQFIYIVIYDIAEQTRLIDNYLMAMFILEDSCCIKRVIHDNSARKWNG